MVRPTFDGWRGRRSMRITRELCEKHGRRRPPVKSRYLMLRKQLSRGILVLHIHSCVSSVKYTLTPPGWQESSWNCERVKRPALIIFRNLHPIPVDSKVFVRATRKDMLHKQRIVLSRYVSRWEPCVQRLVVRNTIVPRKSNTVAMRCLRERIASSRVANVEMELASIHEDVV